MGRGLNTILPFPEDTAQTHSDNHQPDVATQTRRRLWNPWTPALMQPRTDTVPTHRTHAPLQRPQPRPFSIIGCSEDFHQRQAQAATDSLERHRGNGRRRSEGMFY